MATKNTKSAMVTGTLNGQKVTFENAAAAKGYGATLDSSPNKNQVARSTRLQNEVNANGAAPSQNQIKEQFPDLQPGGLAYNGKVTNPTPPNQAVNTTQPSPTTINATPFTGQTPQAPADSATVQKAFQQTLATGQPAPQSAGQAAGLVQGAITNNSPAPTPQTPPEVENFFQTSPLMQTSMQELQEFLAPTETAKMMADSMKKIVKGQKEMASLKFELMDVDRIMAGTEQDLRDEVEATNGFATESQVQALTIGRNKTLLQKAAMIQNKLNYMQDVIQSDMMMYGFQKDMAAQEFQQRSFLLQFKQENDRFIYQATQDAVNRNLQLMGPDGMYNATGGDPLKIQRLEQVMGLQPGGLQQAATQAAQAKESERRQQEFENNLKTRSLALEGGRLALSREQFNYQKQQDALANQPIPGMPTGLDGKPLNQTQLTALGFGTRTLEAGKVIDTLGKKFAKNLKTPNVSIFGFNLTPNALKSEAQQKYEQAQRNFVNAVLRRESGAAISPSEFENAAEQYFPRFGDNEGTVMQKEQNRRIAIQNLLREGGQGNLDPRGLTLTPDGQLVQITN